MPSKAKTAYFIVGLIIFALIAIQNRPSNLAPYMEAKNMETSALSENSYKTSWIGNTFGGGDKWVQIQISALYVAPDGTVYTNSYWDEAAREAGIYKDGDVIGLAEDLHGWGRLGGIAVTATNKYLYVGMQQSHIGEGAGDKDYPPEGKTWYGVRRYDLSGSPVPFSGGRGWDGSILIINTSTDITGLAHADNELYVSDPAANRVRVYDNETMAELRSFSVASPGQIAVDGQGNLWIIQTGDDGNTHKILNYSKTGTLLSKQITDVVEPTALAVDNRGRLLVTENGPRQQVLIYDIAATPVLVDTLGAEGGIYSGTPGEVAPEKFAGLTGVGTDAAGNIYVSLDGFGGSGTDLRKFSSQKELQWQLLGLLFVDNADADPDTDGVNVFTKHEHFVMDYSKDSGQEWTYKAYSLDKFRYPDDLRLHNENHSAASVFIRRIEGKRFMYLTGMYANHLAVYRFDGEIAVPSAMFSSGHSDWPENQPAEGGWLWRDLNGDGSIQDNEYESLGDAGSIWGLEVDSKGDVWQTPEAGYIKHYPFQGLDAYGSPIYTSKASEEIPMPSPFTELERIKYFPETDTMYLSGYTIERPKTEGEWGYTGTEIVCYDQWSTARNIRWRIALPHNTTADPPEGMKAIDVAGDKVFAVTVFTAEVYVYNAKTGAFEMKLSPGQEVAGESGWVDIPYGLRAFRRQNGEYLVFVEEDAKAKIIMYRLASSED